MNIIKTAGFLLLVILWLWLCRGVVTAPGGFTLYKLILICFSGIIIFVPLYRKYIKADSPKEKR